MKNFIFLNKKRAHGTRKTSVQQDLIVIFFSRETLGCPLTNGNLRYIKVRVTVEIKIKKYGGWRLYQYNEDDFFI